MPEEKIVLNVEILNDTGSICLNIYEYNKLVDAAAKLEVIKSMYLNSKNSYHYDEVLSFIFGEKGENEDAE